MKDENKTKKQLIEELSEMRHRIVELEVLETERKQAEETLRGWAHIFEHTAWGVAIGNPDDDTFQMVNPAYAKMHGYTVEELIGTPILDICAPEERAKFPEQTRITTQEGHYIFETKHIRKDGTIFSIQVNATAVKDEDGNVLYRAVNIQDITERKQTEEALRQSEERHRQLIENAKEGITMINGDGRFLLMNHAAARTLEGQPEDYIGKTLWDVIPRQVADERMASIKKVIQSGQGHVVEVPIPILQETRWFIASTQPVRDSSGKITSILNLTTDITERKQAEEALQQSEVRLAGILDLAAEAIISIDETMQIILFNKGAEQSFGYTADEIIGQSLDRLIPERLNAIHRNHIAEFARSATPTLRIMGEHQQIFGRRKNGEEFPAEASISKLELEGQKVFTVILYDVTERKRMEEELRVSEERFRAQYESIPVPTYTWQRAGDDFVLIDHNNAADTMTGDNVSSLMGIPLKKVYQDMPEVLVDFAQCFNEKSTLRKEMLYQFRTSDQRSHLMVTYVFVPPDLIMVHTEDITESKQAEEVLRQSEERYRTLFEDSRDTIYIAARDGQIEDINQAGLDLFGYTKAEITGLNAETIYVRSDDRSRFQQEIEQKGSVRDYEMKLRKKDGTEMDCLITATVRWANNGDILGYQGIIRDITERKRAETALKRLSSIVEQTADYVMITDKEGVIEYVNPAFEKFTGYTGEVVIGYTPRILKSGQHEQKIYEELWETILDGRVFRGVLINRKKNGELFYEEKTITPLKGKEGTITHFVSTGKDITDRKIAEEGLAALNYASRTMASSLDLDTVLEQTMAEVKTLLNVVGAAVLLHDPTGDELIFAAMVGPYPDTMVGTRMPVTAGIAGWAFREGQSALVNDVQEDPRFYNHLDTQTGLATRSILAVPLIFKEKVSGVIEVINKLEGTFTPQDLELLEALASMSAIAIKNAQLHTETEDWAKQLAVLHELDQVITGSLHVDEIYQAFAHHVTRLFPYDRMSIALVEEGEEFLMTYAVDEGHVLPPLGSRLPLESSITGWVVGQAQPLLLHDDTRNISFPQDIPMTATDILSSMVIPLRIKGEVIGTWNIGSQQVRTYNSNDLEIALSLADQLAIAIENARLYEAEQAQRQRVEALQAAGAVVSGTLDIEEVLNRLLEELEKVISLDSSSVFLLEGDALRIAAARGLSDPTILGQQFPYNELATIIEQSQQPLILTDAQTDPRFQPLGNNDYVRSWMGIPLIAEGRFIGYFTIDNSRPGVYSQADADLTLSFANQAAIAVEKARLFADLKQQMKALREAQYELVQSEKMAAIGRLSTSLAHEINNPIQAIQNSLSLIKEEVGDQVRLDKIDFFADIAKTELDRIATIIRRMREFSRIPLREQSYDPDSAPIEYFYHLTRDDAQTIDLYVILEEILDLANKQLQNSKVKVKRTWADRLPSIQGDPDQLKQVFMNLTLNAVDAMIGPGGTLHIRIKPDEAKLHSNQPRPVVRIEFNDTGEGVSPEVLPRLFEPLVSTKTEGWGFGLFTSHKIIEAHHGQITVASQVGKGTTFTILLPLEQPLN